MVLEGNAEKIIVHALTHEIRHRPRLQRCFGQTVLREISIISVDPGPSGGISFWLGGNSGAAFLQAGGGQAGVDAVNALDSPKPAVDAGATAKMNSPQPQPPEKKD
jgi:hypothetical protein